MDASLHDLESIQSARYYIWWALKKLQPHGLYVSHLLTQSNVINGVKGRPDFTEDKIWQSWLLLLSFYTQECGFQNSILQDTGFKTL